MKRRTLLQTGLAGIAYASVSITTRGMNMTSSIAKPHYYELRAYETRNDLQPNRLIDFMQKHLIPSLNKLGIEKVAVFRGQTGMQTPGLLLVIDYPSLAELQSVQERLAADKEFTQATLALEATNDLPYVRYESSIYRAFTSHTEMEVPAPINGPDGKPALRLFELRTYESRTNVSLKNKIEMFNQEEIKIFRDCGFAPIFFGECIAGPRQPALTYLVGFDNMVHRDKAWATFVASPDFNRIKVKPGWTDPEAVSNIRSSFIRPLPFSVVR